MVERFIERDYQALNQYILEIIQKYFKNLKEDQIIQFEQLWDLYQDWNAKINVISRKDIDNLYTHHVLHSLAIAKYLNFTSGTSVLDLGCGGGFPGIPLAILFPHVKFHSIDGIKKKITVVNEVAGALGLQNLTAEQKRAEELKAKYDFVIIRAVATVDKLMMWSRRLIHHNHRNAIPNGLIALKGGRVKEEAKMLPSNEYVELEAISKWFEEPFFEDKYIMYVQG